jgi:hypothetical protein
MTNHYRRDQGEGTVEMRYKNWQKRSVHCTQEEWVWREEKSGEWFVKRQLSTLEMNSFMDGAESKREHELTKKKDGKNKFRGNGHKLLQRQKEEQKYTVHIITRSKFLRSPRFVFRRRISADSRFLSRFAYHIDSFKSY